MGLSHFLPGGNTSHEATPLEKVYVVIRGEITVVTDEARRLSAVSTRATSRPTRPARVVNRTNDVASMIVVMPYPGGPR